ncbi:DNRLRE domain-containing protein [Nonomuraea sp. B1E8]|uniref:DNRLRE domain-containing protein n=1 Tax=unclassified Nonomuraea TaxID=2593643 RepID=UPI00325ED0A0
MVSEGGRTELVVKPDQAFLADAGTTYPVRVAAAVALPVSADMEVTTHDTVDSPALPDTSIIMAGTMAGYFKSRTHLKIDTPGLQGSTVTKATLSMNTIDSHNCGTALARGIQVARLTGAWDPENLYWGGMPAFTTEDASTNFKGVNARLCGLAGQHGVGRHRHRPGLGRRRRQSWAGAQVARRGGRRQLPGVHLFGGHRLQRAADADHHHHRVGAAADRHRACHVTRAERQRCHRHQFLDSTTGGDRLRHRRSQPDG